jgi:hypothetical protein
MAQRDWFVEAFGRAITDVREKVVEEPWFGRKLTRPGEHAPPRDNDPFAATAKDRSVEHDQTHDSDEHEIDR